MAGSEPYADGNVPGGEPTAPAGSPGARRRRRGWWWLLVGAVALVVVLLVVRPWSTDDATSPTPTTSTSAASTSTPTPTVSVVPPADDAMFDATTLDGLFLTVGDLEAGLPLAADGIERTDDGTITWGLPDGLAVSPPGCALTETVVAQPPAAFGARRWANDAVEVTQEVTVLPDPATARQAFAELVTTVDACPEYSVGAPDTDGAGVGADAAIEGQGVYPSIVQPLTMVVEGDGRAMYRGYVLVGNTIVSWSVATQSDDDPQQELDTLGEPESLDTMVQQRAQKAVLGLG
ncbi:sensor domain-containing protein [Cellulomonas sp. H30R-01]|uniref:sensor domain-containing protein n=1 Tax=Cellulomonas sp. H30R-01 TaxID=2704467 RepID=UPI00138BB7DF|nr:sensor domain-containing protein [Cellulomonas sp. H30R-01]QHT55058.1 sensor domain-containing protein [Cellulomonas sp. H30R-01]